MAQLTWREVSAPNFGGVQDSINSAARLLGGASTGLSTAFGQFGDQRTLQELAKYSDAQKLQEDVASGQFNTANASAEALGKIMSRPSNLIENATAQQQLAYRGELNPLLLKGKGLENDAAVLGNAHAAINNPLIEAKNRQYNVGTLDTFNEMVGNRNAGYAATAWYDKNVQSGALDTVEGINGLRQEIGQMDPRMQQILLPKLAAINPDAFTPQLMTGATAGAVGSAPSASGLIANAGSAGTPVVGKGTSVGERNNNQGNLMGSGWVTKMPGYLGNDDKGFAKFSTTEEGTAANNRQLERYWDGTQATGGKPVRTIDGIINTWAPPETGTNKTGNSAESVANYKKYVQTRTGIDMTKELTKDQLGSVRTAMQEFETGNVAKGALTAKDAAKVGKSGTAVAALADTVVKTDSMFSANPLAAQMFKAGQSDPQSLKSEAEIVAELGTTFKDMKPQDLAKLIGETRAKLGGVSAATVAPLLLNSAGAKGGFLGFGQSYGVDTDKLAENIKSMVGDGKTPGVAFRKLMDEQARQQQTASVSEDLKLTNDARKKAVQLLKTKAEALPAGPRRDAQVQAAQAAFDSEQEDAVAAVQAAASRGSNYEVPVVPVVPAATATKATELLNKAAPRTLEDVVGANTGDASINSIIAKNIPRIQAAADNVKVVEAQMAQVARSGDPVAIQRYARMLQSARDDFEVQLKDMSPQRAAEVRKLVG